MSEDTIVSSDMSLLLISETLLRGMGVAVQVVMRFAPGENVLP